MKLLVGSVRTEAIRKMMLLATPVIEIAAGMLKTVKKLVQKAVQQPQVLRRGR